MTKSSFLVFKHQRYLMIPTETIAYFYVRDAMSFIRCFDQQEYFVNYSLDRLQSMVAESQFFRLNRQYLINFHAVKEVEHFFARKLLVKPAVEAADVLLVPKEKVRGFFHWLENR